MRHFVLIAGCTAICKIVYSVSEWTVLKLQHVDPSRMILPDSLVDHLGY